MARAIRPCRQASAQPREAHSPSRIARRTDTGGDPPEQPLGDLRVGHRDDCRIEHREPRRVQRHRAGEQAVEAAFARNPLPTAGTQLGDNAVRRGAAEPVGSGAQPRTLERRVQIARIAQEGLALLREQCQEARPWHRQERPNQPAPCQFTDRRHPRQPVDAAARAAADQVGLDLVLAMVRGQQVKNAMCAAPLREQPVAGVARRFLDAARRLVAGPHQDFVRDGAAREPTGNGAGLLGAFGPQSVVDGQRPGPPAALLRPVLRQEDEGQAVGPAGDRDRDKRLGLEAAERLERGGKLVKAQRTR